MGVSPSFRTFVEDQLGALVPIRSRGMFGGVGLYSEDLFFGLLDDDVLYLKADDETRADFEALGSRPFRPYGPEGGTMSYYDVPADLLEDPDRLRPWVERALAAARRSS